MMKKMISRLTKVVALSSIVAGTPCPTLAAQPHLRRWHIPVVSIAAIGIVEAATTIWALVERSRKKGLVKQLGTARTKIKAYENQEADQIFFDSCTIFLEEMNHQYKQWDTFFAQNKNTDQASEDFVQKGLNLLNRSNNIDAHLQDAVQKKGLLEFKQSGWSESVQTKYPEQANTLLQLLNEHIESLQAAHAVVTQQKPYLSLVHHMDSVAKDYFFEMRFDPQAQYAETYLDRHIRTQRNATAFSYVTYANRLQNACQSLEVKIQHAASRAIPFQQPLIQQARNHLQALQNLLAFVVTSAEYKEQCAKKIVHDREEQILAIERRERQARIDQSNKIADAKVQAKRNKARQLENEQLEIQRQLAFIAQQAIQAQLEFKKAKTKKAIKENDKKWQERVGQLKQNLEKIRRDISQVQEMAACPPCNPDSIDGLRDYVNRLLFSLQRIQSDIGYI